MPMNYLLTLAFLGFALVFSRWALTFLFYRERVTRWFAADIRRRMPTLAEDVSMEQARVTVLLAGPLLACWAAGFWTLFVQYAAAALS